MKNLLLSGCLYLINLPIHAQDILFCRIETNLGSIDLELYAKQAPVTVTNFLRYVDAGLYANTSFFRVTTPKNEVGRTVRIEVIQGGEIERKNTFLPIPIETTKQTGIRHQEGTISMARDEPNTATSQFFISINDQPSLDYGGARNPDGYGFAAFGKVIHGMAVVKKIQQGESKNQRLVQPVRIINITRIQRPLNDR